MQDPRIIVVTGPPGAGKSTVTKVLADSFDPCVLLEGDRFFGSIHRGRLAPWTEEANEQNLTVIRAIGAAAAEYVVSGYTVVVDGIIGPWFLNEFVRSAQHRVHYVVLRPSKEVCAQRAGERQAPALTDPEPVSLTYDTFCALGEFEGCVIDSTALNLDETLRAVMSYVLGSEPIWRDSRGPDATVRPS